MHTYKLKHFAGRWHGEGRGRSGDHCGHRIGHMMVN
jgi:hypothetical protein